MLQVDWLITRLRPSGVSSGSIETQLLCTEQSPQPSQTRWLMKTRVGGSSIRPRLRRRRFSAAQVWSKTIAVQPSTARNSTITRSIASRWRRSVPGASSAPRQVSGLSDSSTTFLTPSCCS